MRAIVVGEDKQALGRSRGIRRGPSDPVLEISVNNLVDASTNDAVLDWGHLQALDERAAVMHGYGVVPLKAAEFRRLAPELCSSSGRCKQLLRRRSKHAPAPLLPACVPDSAAAPAYKHPLLIPADPRMAVVAMRYTCGNIKKSLVWLDANRPAAGAEALAKALNMPLLRWEWIKPSKTDTTASHEKRTPEVQLHKNVRCA
jgi:hypothetical protein